MNRRIIISLIFAITVQLLFSVLLIKTFDESVKQAKTPKAIDNFLEFFVTGDYEHTLLNFHKYLSAYEGVEEDPSDGYGLVEFWDFESVFKAMTPGIVGYEAVTVKDGYTEITILTLEGESYPKIAFWYTLDRKGKIVDYTLGRLLPLSKYDSEYSEVWDEYYS